MFMTNFLKICMCDFKFLYSYIKLTVELKADS